MTEKELKTVYQDENVLVIDKPAGINSDEIEENKFSSSILRYARLFQKRVHRLDKDTSGILLIAKNDKALEFLQKQFKERKVIKKYIALIIGNLKNKEGLIETLLGRSSKDRRKQKVYLPYEPNADGKRKAITEYRVLQKLKKYTLIEVRPITGRKHQIRAHFAHLDHPIAGDKMYGFKNQPCPKNLKRQFLHASLLRITLPNGEIKKFYCELPEDLSKVLKTLNSKIKDQNAK